MAYSADKGEKLFEIQTNLSGGMGPPITYQLDGTQYVAFMGGVGRVVNPNAANNAANAATNIAGPHPENAPATAPTGPNFRSGKPPKLLVFALDGKAPLPE